jgi:hypothetical protein
MGKDPVLSVKSVDRRKHSLILGRHLLNINMIFMPVRFDHRFMLNIIIIDCNHLVMGSIFVCE